jgi:hypothetical protein
VIYAGFVATNGLAPSSERVAEGAIVPNKLNIVQPNNIQQTLALIIYTIQQVIQKRLFPISISFLVVFVLQ